MKKLPVGLVIEGNSTTSSLLRLGSVASQIGPIKSSGLTVARRVSNFLKGGSGVSSYAELASARTILIRVPETAVDRVISEIGEADLKWADHSFVLCETWCPTEKLQPLKALGAGIASLVALPTAQGLTFAVEGDLPVVRQVRRLISQSHARSIELRPATKHLLFAASALCTAIPLSLLVMAQQLLRDGGVSGKQLSAIIEEMSSEMLLGFVKGARMTWGGTLADNLRTTGGHYWEQLDLTHPDVAIVLRELVRLSQLQMAPKLGRGHSA